MQLEACCSPAGLGCVAPDVAVHRLFSPLRDGIRETYGHNKVLLFGIDKNILSKGTSAAGQRAEYVLDQLVGAISLLRRKHWVLRT